MDISETSAAPVIILSHPQMGENIGAAARVMRNFGLCELRLIAPRDGWPNEKAGTLAAGAFGQMRPVRIFEDTPSAIADLQTVFAVTARIRDMEKPVLSPEAAMLELRKSLAKTRAVGLLFGGEASGLCNAEVAACDGIITYPVDPDFRSLNLAQAVAVAAFAWSSSGEQGKLPEGNADLGQNPLARRDELQGMLGHLRNELDAAGFFFPPEKEDLMMQNLQNMFVRSQLTKQEVQTFRGVIKALSKGRGPFSKGHS